MKKIIFLVLITLQFLPASAIRIEYGNNVIISNPVHEDLYLAGGTITINAPVYGDLIIAGGTVIINDTVTNDILIAGGTITLNGYVGDDIRCAGGTIRIGKNVGGDVVITGGRINIDRNVTIGNLLVSGGTIVIDGTINGEIKGGFGELTLNGTALKNIDCRGGRITINGTIEGLSVLAAREIIIGDHAAFNNTVRYWNKRGEVDFKQSLKNGKAVYDPELRIKSGQWYYLGAATVLGLLWYLGMALTMIFIVQYLFSNTMRKAADTVFSDTLRSLGVGTLFFIGTPLVALATFITIIGVPVGVLLLFGYIFLILLATVITSVVGASWINNRYNKNWNNVRLTFTAFALFILLKLLTLIPVAGWIMIILFVCASFGSILLNIRWRRKNVINQIN